MAWVYEVEETRGDGSHGGWAMKELRVDPDDAQTLAESRAMFAQEANILVALHHPNLPQVSAFFDEGGRSYLIMEFIHGESLEKRLERANAPLLESEVLDWAVQICDVLTYLHGQPQPVIFRDLKPSNVMVTLEGRVKLIDFGIARTYKSGQRRDTVTMGSENYAAPEQWGQAQTDPRADIYSLGATMYHCSPTCRRCRPLCPPRGCPCHNTTAPSARHRGHHRAGHVADRTARYPPAAAMRAALLDSVPRRDRRRMEQRSAQVADTLNTGGLPTAPAATPAPVAPAPQPYAPESPVPMAVPATPHELVTPPAGLASVNPPTASAGAADLPLDSWRTARCPLPGGCGERRRWGGRGPGGHGARGAYLPAVPDRNSPAARYCRHCGFALVAAPAAGVDPGAAAEAHWEYPLRERDVWWGVLEAPRWWTWTWLSMSPGLRVAQPCAPGGRQSPLPAHRPGERQRHLRQRRAVGAPRAPPVAPGRPPAPGAGGARISYSLMAACERRRGGTAPSAR
jgi:hypothetical protein